MFEVQIPITQLDVNVPIAEHGPRQKSLTRSYHFLIHIVQVPLVMIQFYWNT
jgi:hypothetical protein